MSDILVDIHSMLRWPVLAALLVAGAYALLRSPRATEFARWPFSTTVALLDLQFLLGVVVYVLTSGWEERTFIAVVHPAVMVVAVAVAHAAVVRADREGGQRGYQIVGAAFTGLIGLVALGIPWMS